MAENFNDISEESEHDLQDIGYHTRLKRRKLGQNEEENDSKIKDSLELKRKNPIMHVPLEVLTEIFKRLPYEELAKTVRPVNRRFKNVAENMLNLTFLNVETKLSMLKKSTNLSLAYTQEGLEIKNISKLISLLDYLQLQFDLTYATIWRYVYNNYYKASKSCMYGGQIIDAYQEFMRKFLHMPQGFIASTTLGDYEFPPEVTNIIKLTKLFCIHFDKVNEEPMPKCLIDSGCKMLDIMDAARFVDKKTAWEFSTKDSFNAQYVYFFRNSWFIGVPIRMTKETEPRQNQKMMHLRIRRIVLAHNEMNLTQAHYDRDLTLVSSTELRVKKPHNAVYTGYGEVGDIFFYYGVMNESAYREKFHIDTDLDDIDANVDDNGENQIDENFNLQVQVENSNENMLYSIPHLGFRVLVNLRCPLAYAPWQYLKKLNPENFQTSKRIKKTKDMTNIKMTFECFGASYPRLPSTYQYDFCPNEY